MSKTVFVTLPVGSETDPPESNDWVNTELKPKPFIISTITDIDDNKIFTNEGYYDTPLTADQIRQKIEEAEEETINDSPSVKDYIDQHDAYEATVLEQQDLIQSLQALVDRVNKDNLNLEQQLDTTKEGYKHTHSVLAKQKDSLQAKIDKAVGELNVLKHRRISTEDGFYYSVVLEPIIDELKGDAKFKKA